jgi:hypothetical protein
MPTDRENGGRMFKDTDPMCVALFGHSRDYSSRRRENDEGLGLISNGGGDAAPERRKLQSAAAANSRSLLVQGSSSYRDCWRGRDMHTDQGGGRMFKDTDPMCVALFGHRNEKGRDNRRRRGGIVGMMRRIGGMGG